MNPSDPSTPQQPVEQQAAPPVILPPMPGVILDAEPAASTQPEAPVAAPQVLQPPVAEPTVVNAPQPLPQMPPEQPSAQPQTMAQPQQPTPASLMDATPPVTPPKKSRKKLLIGLLAGGALLGLIVFGVIAFIAAGSPKYTSFKTTETGKTSGEKSSFSYPSEMVEVAKIGDTAEYADYVSDNKKAIYSQVNVDSASVGQLTPESIEAFKDIMKNKKDGYEETVGAFKKETVNEATDLKFENFSDFKSDKIASGLKADFSYKSKSNGKIGKGRLIFAFGKQRLYAMVLLGEQSVWDKNTAAWNTVADSFTIDRK